MDGPSPSSLSRDGVLEVVYVRRHLSTQQRTRGLSILIYEWQQTQQAAKLVSSSRQRDGDLTRLQLCSWEILPLRYLHELNRLMAFAKSRYVTCNLAKFLPFVHR